jgi:hypothetical protein
MHWRFVTPALSQRSNLLAIKLDTLRSLVARRTPHFLTLYTRPLGRDSHEVSLHGSCKSTLVQWWLNDRRRFATNHHGKALAHALHLLEDIVLTHKINNSDHKLVVFRIHAHKNRVVQDIDN